MAEVVIYGWLGGHALSEENRTLTTGKGHATIMYPAHLG